jgi:hypothetical protein
MRRKDIPRNRCSGTWTEAQFNTFVRNQLRGASWKWKPISEAMKKAKVGHGVYICQGCLHNVPVTIVVNGKRIKNVFVDHTNPIVDPVVGFVSWDEFINRLYCEEDNLQVLCGECHDKKSYEETQIAKERKKKEKEENE